MSEWWEDDNELDKALGQLGTPPAAKPNVTPEMILSKAAALTPVAATTGLAGWKLGAVIGAATAIGFGGGIVVDSSILQTEAPKEPVVQEEITPLPEVVEEPEPIVPVMDIPEPPKVEPMAPVVEEQPKVSKPVAKRQAPRKESRQEPPLSQPEPIEVLAAKPKDNDVEPPKPEIEPPAAPQTLVVVDEEEEPESTSPEPVKPEPVVPEAPEVLVEAPKKKAKKKSVQKKKMGTGEKWKGIALETSFGIQAPLEDSIPVVPTLSFGVSQTGDGVWHHRVAARGEATLYIKEHTHFVPSLTGEVGIGHRGAVLRPSLSLTAGVRPNARKMILKRKLEDPDFDDELDGDDKERMERMPHHAIVFGPQLRLDLGDKFWMAGQYRMDLLKKDADWFGLQIGMDFPI
ncbi:MAG: hypothetical protein VX278_15685 [Myxococcota bacterium]|nr:hypothetical protein [Myxococcota bacterium]